MPFTEKDGDILRGLRRKEELERLLGYVLEDQIPLVVLRENPALAKPRFCVPACLMPRKEERPNHLLGGLANQPHGKASSCRWVRLGRRQGGAAPEDLGEATRVLVAGPIRTVIVRDQFDQLSPEAATYQPLFEVLKGFVSSGTPPYRLTWVVAFRPITTPLGAILN
jgi:hypothetical protein